MRPTVFQKAELRDENDNIVQQGTYGKGSALSNSTNDAWIDYVMNNLEALRSMSVGATITVETLPESGETGKAYVVTTGTDAGKLFMWDGEDWVEITGSIGDYLPITGGTITGNLAVEGNLTAVTQLPNDNSTKAATTEYVQNEVKPIETDVDIADKRISNIEKLLQGNLYDYQTDNTSAYTKTVPSGAMPYAGLEQIGGKTVAWNQYGKIPTNSSAATVTWTNDNGVLHFTGTATGIATFIFTQNEMPVTAGQKIAYGNVIENNSTGNPQIQIWIKHDGTQTIQGTTQNGYKIFTAEHTGTILMYLICYANDVVDMKIAPFVSNLTLLAGEGNEPATVADFQQMFPANVYSYSAPTLLSAGVTEVVSKDGNNATLQTYSIPTAIRNLEGYGYGCLRGDNYIDFEAKKYVQRTKKIALTSSLNWGYSSVNGIFNVSNLINGYVTDATTQHDAGFVVCNKLVEKSWVDRQSTDLAVGLQYGGSSIFVRNSAYTDVNQFKTWLDTMGLECVYVLRESAYVETDISQYITDDNLIEVEANGTLTFPNSNGDDYQIPVPSEETYMIDLQEAISNG